MVIGRWGLQGGYVAGPHPTNTIFLIVGVSGFLGGIIWLLIALISK
jgi:hypothetical protein